MATRIFLKPMHHQIGGVPGQAVLGSHKMKNLQQIVDNQSAGHGADVFVVAHLKKDSIRQSADGLEVARRHIEESARKAAAELKLLVKLDNMQSFSSACNYIETTSPVGIHHATKCASAERRSGLRRIKYIVLLQQSDLGLRRDSRGRHPAWVSNHAQCYQMPKSVNKHFDVMIICDPAVRPGADPIDMIREGNTASENRDGPFGMLVDGTDVG